MGLEDDEIEFRLSRAVLTILYFYSIEKQTLAVADFCSDVPEGLSVAKTRSS